MSEAIKINPLEKSNENIAKSRIPKPSSNNDFFLLQDEGLEVESKVEMSFKS